MNYCSSYFLIKLLSARRATIALACFSIVIAIICHHYYPSELSKNIFLGSLILFIFLAGCATTTTLVVKALRQANLHIAKLMTLSRHKLHDDIPLAVDIRDSHILPTGIDELDKLVSNSRRSIEHLFDLLYNLGSKIEDLIDRYEVLTNNLAASVIMRDTSGKTLFCSPYAEVLTGYSQEEIAAFKDDFLANIVLDEDMERYKRSSIISNLGEDIVVRYRIRHKSGITIWVESHLVPICDDDNTVISVMSVSIDVTASVRYQEQIEQQNRDLSDFTYMVSHDLKAPIFTIKGMAAILIEDYANKLDAEGLDFIRHIIDATNRLEALVKSVLEYSSLSTGRLAEERVSLNNIIKQALSDLSQQTRDAKATINVDDNLPTVSGDPLRLYQVFSNLIGNAIKYRSPERALTVDICLKTISVDSVILDIADNGLGIPKNRLADVLRPYHRAHGNEIEGSGIGLACVKKILDKLDGSIEIFSVEGKGSVFRLTLKRPTRQERDEQHRHNEHFDSR